MADKNDQGMQPVSAPAPPSTQVQAASPQPEPGVIQLPAPASPTPGIAAEQPPAWFSGFDRFQIVLLLVLAFFLGSFAARNSDVYLHLAIGRLIGQGEWTVGVDPFSIASEATSGHEAVYWVNHSWFYSWLFYVLHSMIGGAGLVLLKALAVAGIVLCMFAIRGPGTPRMLSLVVIGLATLALSLRVLLQPTVISMLLLGITLLILYRGGALGDRPANPRLLWWLPALCALWANLDSWFILGPLTLGVLWAGAGLGAYLGAKNEIPGKILGLLFGVSLLACLANPHHLRVFQLPTDLAYILVRIVDLPDYLGAGGSAAQALKGTEIYPLFSPLTRDYLRPGNPGSTLAGLAYYPLLLVGALSFIAVVSLANKPSAPALHPGRSLLWVVLALLSINQWRLIPFFAIAAGPIAVLNLANFLAWRESFAPKIQVPNWRPAKLARALTLVALLGLIYLVWPGWIVGTPGDFHSVSRVDWSIHADPSLERAAEKLKALTQAGQSPRVFNFSPDLANYCAWFAPGVKCFLDYRLALFPQEALPYVKTRKAMRDEADRTFGDFSKLSAQQMRVLVVQKAEARASWEKAFKKHRIDHVALVNFEPLLVYKLWFTPHHWTQEYADGRSLVFAWSGPDKTLPPDILEAELARKAFGTVALEDRAPEHGAVFFEGDRSFWSQYFSKQSPPPLGLSETNLWGAYHQAMANRWKDAFNLAQIYFGGSISAGGNAGAAFAIPSMVNLYTKVYPVLQVAPSGRPFLRAKDFGPPGAPLLMVRAARRAVQENPDDPAVYLGLANAYKTLRQKQEDFWANYAGLSATGFRGKVRQIQILTAMRTYTNLHPDDPNSQENLATIHENLATIFEGDLYFLDLALEHWGLAAQLVKNIPPDPRNPQAAEILKKRSDFLQDQEKKLDAVIKERRDAYGLKVATLQGLDKYRWAINKPYQTVDKNNQPVIDPRGYGLALEALGALEKLTENSQVLEDKDKAEVVDSHLRLLLQMGRAGEVADLLPKVDIFLGPNRHEFQALVAAALGDYAQFDQSLLALEKTLDPVWALGKAGAAAYPAGMALANHQPFFQCVASMNWNHGILVLYLENFLGRPAAELRSLRGLMALEQGDTAKAKTLLQDALQLAGPHTYFPNRLIVERYLQLLGN